MHKTQRSAALLLTILLSAAAWLTPQSAQAFCGFYVSGASKDLSNNATQVTLMRHGERTVLSMQNNYKGPPEDFALVIPVPVVLQEENVKTLPKDVFERVDQMAAPRLVEYWERDPCYKPPRDWDFFDDGKVYNEAAPSPTAAAVDGGAVKVEAEFAVGEYQVVILSANDSGALDAWLKEKEYKIPSGAEPVLRPYVEAGTKFFVAKVDSKKVKFEDGKAKLSPLRFHYDTKDFNLPIRLGLLNANGPQDLIVHILAQEQRYEAANYKNVTVPTNIIVDEPVREDFAGFYAALFDRTLESNPGAVVTEYSWAASTCDPCPGPTLNSQDFGLLGADVMPNTNPWRWVLTRLHTRYTKDNLGEDLVFKAAPPIVGGRGTPDNQGELAERGSQPGPVNNFQGRYIILNLWEGDINCMDPKRGVWGGPPKGGNKTHAAKNMGDVDRKEGVKLASLVREDVPSLDIKAEGGGFQMPEAQGSVCGCTCSTAHRQGTPLWPGTLLAIGLGAFVWAVRRRRG